MQGGREADERHLAKVRMQRLIRAEERAELEWLEAESQAAA